MNYDTARIYQQPSRNRAGTDRQKDLAWALALNSGRMKNQSDLGYHWEKWGSFPSISMIQLPCLQGLIDNQELKLGHRSVSPSSLHSPWSWKSIWYFKRILVTLPSAAFCSIWLILPVNSSQYLFFSWLLINCFSIIFQWSRTLCQRYLGSW